MFLILHSILARKLLLKKTNQLALTPQWRGLYFFSLVKDYLPRQRRRKQKRPIQVD